MAEHDPHMVIIGLNDPGPWIRFVQRCTCGAELSSRRYDVRYGPFDPKADGAVDGELWNQHYRDATGEEPPQ